MSESKEVKPIKSDGLFKKIMEDPVAAREFLEHYLPSSIKEIVDLSQISIEKESYVEEDLKRALSDVVFSVRIKESSEGTNNNNKDISNRSNREGKNSKQERSDNPAKNDRAFIYTLLEQQSKPDHWISFRLWKYMLLLCERHKQGKDKLPLVVPMVFYNGSKRYTAPKNIWELFTDPTRARELMSNDYQLIDLQSMSDDEIKKKQHLGMMEYFMKYIHARDMLGLWDKFMNEFTEAIMIDKENGYIYLKSFLWYTDALVIEDQQQELGRIINKHLATNETSNIMRTIAQKYIDEGMELGRLEGMEKGIERGIEKAATNMLKQKLDLKLIAQVTGLSVTKLNKLQANI